MKHLIDNVVMSSNEDPLYIDFWPIAAWANRVVLGVEPHLAFLTNRDEADPYVAELRRHGAVTLYGTHEGVPDCNLVKMVRSIHCSKMGSKVGYIQDIDLIPLQPEWPGSKVQQRSAGTLLLCGAEVYNAHTPEQKHLSSAPASMMTAEGDVWKKLLNPNDLSYHDLVESWANRSNHKPNEDIRTRVYHELESCFSDERFMRTLRLENQIPATQVERGYNIERDTLDRSCWNLNMEKLNAGGYLESHAPRPLYNHLSKIEPMVEFISKKYGGGTMPLVPSFQLGFQRERCKFVEGGISKELLFYILDRWSSGAALEFGSGDVSTRYFGDVYDITSVEPKKEWLNRHNATYIHTPLEKGNYDFSFNQYPHLWKRQFKFVLLDGPRANSIECGMMDQIRRLQAEAFIINSTNDPDYHTLAVGFGSKLGRKVEWHDNFAVI